MRNGVITALMGLSLAAAGCGTKSEPKKDQSQNQTPAVSADEKAQLDADYAKIPTAAIVRVPVDASGATTGAPEMKTVQGGSLDTADAAASAFDSGSAPQKFVNSKDELDGDSSTQSWTAYSNYSNLQSQYPTGTGTGAGTYPTTGTGNGTYNNGTYNNGGVYTNGTGNGTYNNGTYNNGTYNNGGVYTNGTGTYNNGSGGVYTNGGYGTTGTGGYNSGSSYGNSYGGNGYGDSYGGGCGSYCSGWGHDYWYNSYQPVLYYGNQTWNYGYNRPSYYSSGGYNYYCYKPYRWW